MAQTVATNKKAFRDYFFSDQWECGIELKGAEVKSVRDGKVNFKDTYAQVQKGEVFVHNLQIDPYKQASYMNDEPDRPRKLLLHKREIHKINGIMMQKNVVLVPTKIYFNNRGLVKVEVALGTGKKRYDKRAAIQKRDVERDLRRAIKNRKR
ncbi:MAG: SsrA-binding protein SmpB [Candidatus Omnitrophica bacterium]|nr:SsrA-binding protein SmpB [Candidatus Omnitrophota bacterium]